MCVCMHASAHVCVSCYMYMLYRYMYMYGDAAQEFKTENKFSDLTGQTADHSVEAMSFKIGMSALLLAKVSPTLAGVDSIPCVYDTFVAHIL